MIDNEDLIFRILRDTWTPESTERLKKLELDIFKRGHTEEAKMRMSISQKKISKKTSIRMLKYHRTHKGNHPKLRFVEALGHGIRSSWEEEIALMLKNNGIRYGYETTRFDLGDGSYTPDFEITPTLFIEVKGWLFPKNKEKILKFKEMYPKITLIGIGNVDEKVFSRNLKWKDRSGLLKLMEESGYENQ